MADPMTTLQNRWYNGLTGSLPGLDAKSFQISQPCPPITPTNKGLWGYANVIPPASLTFDRGPSTASFFAGYAAVIGQLEAPENVLVQTIGQQNTRKWNAYLAKLTPQPPPPQLPVIFRNWAMFNAPTVMNEGASALARINLLTAAHNAIKPYQGPKARPVDFDMQYRDVLQFVDHSTGASVSVNGGTSANVEDTWTGGDQSGVQGLWRQSLPDDPLSTLFAASEVSVEASFQHFGLWVSSPGSWYQSSLLHLAYSNAGPPVWVQNADPSWNAAFGEDGFLRRFLVSLAIVDGVQATVTSNAVYSESDRQAILAHAQEGLWPFYAPTGAGVASTVTFGAEGMTIQCSTAVGNPLVLGDVALGIAQYLGQ
jgi:hypothetical protein